MTFNSIGNGGEGARERVPHEADDLVEGYTLIAKEVGINPKVVYHPCGEYDVSPSNSKVFPGARVVYVDANEDAMQTLREAGYEAHVEDANTYDPEASVDLVILLNPQIKPDGPVSHLAPGGYVIANNYHKTALELKDNPNFAFVGVARRSGSHFSYDASDLEDYWKPVETEEELKQLPLYDIYAGDIERLKPDIAEDAVGEFDAAQGVFAKHMVLQNLVRDGKVSGTWKKHSGAYMRDGDMSYILSGFPSKKGSVDDLYVFRKRS
jgi:hypothetical protein